MTSAGVVRAEARKATIGVVIVDDHPLFRQGLRQLVESDERFALIAEADSGETAKRLIMQHRPDLAVLDVNLPDITGLDVAEIIRAAGLNTRFVVLTMLKDEQAFNRAMNIGIDGYILKENASTEIINCMLSVAGGNAYVSPSLTGFLLRRRGRAEALSHKPGLDDLTTAERRILKRIAQKKTSREIAAELHISPRTVETHRTNICTKLSLKGSNSLLQFAIENREALKALE
jgi:DNA-binding NarL/FixJ family response regulator